MSIWLLHLHRCAIRAVRAIPAVLLLLQARGINALAIWIIDTNPPTQKVPVEKKKWKKKSPARQTVRKM